MGSLIDFSLGSFSEEEDLMLAMFHYDMWQKSGTEPGFVDFRESVKKAIKTDFSEMMRIAPSKLFSVFF